MEHSCALRSRCFPSGLRKVTGLCILLIALLHVTVVDALPKLNPFSRTGGPFSRKGTVLADSFPTEKVLDASEGEVEVSTSVTEIAANKLGALASIFYGACLLLHPNDFKAQLHVFTMMRAVGFGKLETAAVKARQNFRQAIGAAIFRAPSLLMMRKSLRQYQDRIGGHRHVQKETRKAMEDGVVTPAERRKINRIKRREIRALKRDMRRVKAGSSSLGRVWQVLDFDEILDILRQFFFILSTVLATGSNDSIVGKMIARYCHFLNLGQLTSEINGRLGFPFTKFVLYQEFSDDELEEEELTAVRNIGKGFCYSVSALLIVFKRKIGFRLNTSLMASLIVVRGIMTTIGWRTGVFGVLEDSLARDEDGEVQRYVTKRRVSATLIIALTAVSMCCSKEEGSCIGIPESVLKPVVFLEDAVTKFVILAQKVF